MASLALPIGLISSLNRAEEVSVPRWPLEFTKTAAPPGTVAPLIPLIKVAVIIEVPIRMVLLSPGGPETPKPILMFSSPVVRFSPAFPPQGSVMAAGRVASERTITHGCIQIACTAEERTCTYGCISSACAEAERTTTDGGVKAA